MTLERIGPYRIVRLLGKGGMGAVYEGFHETIERRVAIKVLHADLALRPDIATRFINEARSVNRIEHPGLVQISDYGHLPDGTAYIVMEFLKGETLGQRLKHLQGRLPTADVIRLGRQLGSALAAAHDKEIVHRDLKPDNIMIVPNPDVPGGEQIKILDFGIAKVAEARSGMSESNTHADALLGTPRYMSPEQCKGSGGVDAKSDVYALGVIFYEAMAGQPPFVGSAYGELLVQHIAVPPPSLGPLVEPSAPDALVQLVHRMLQKDKAARPTMRQVVAEMDRLGGYLSGVYGIISMPFMGNAYSGSVQPVTPSSPNLVAIPGMGAQPGTSALQNSQSPGNMPSPYPPHESGPALVKGAQASTLRQMGRQAPATPRPRWVVATAVGSVAGAVLVGVLLLLMMNKPNPQPALVPLPPPKQLDPPFAEAKGRQVNTMLRTHPDGATVVRQRDGQVLGMTPLSLTYPAGSGTEKVRIVLKGYVDEPVMIDLEKDAAQTINLRPKNTRPFKRVSKRVNAKTKASGDLTIVD